MLKNRVESEVIIRRLPVISSVPKICDVHTSGSSYGNDNNVEIRGAL